MPIYGSKFQIPIALKSQQLFNMSKKCQKLALNGPWSSQLVRYSKIQTRVSRTPWAIPMDWFLMKSVNAVFFLMACGTPISVAHPPKMELSHSLVIWYLKPLRFMEDLSLLHQENFDFLKVPNFGNNSQMVLESPKVDTFQKWPSVDIRDVSSCLESKFDKEIPM